MKPRWTFAKDTAMQLIKAASISFPVNLVQLVDRLPKVQLMSYNTMVNKICNHGMPVDVNWVQEHLADGSQDAALVKMSNRDELIILYNSDTLINIPQRIRFSIAHEIGHYLLNHPFVTSIARQGETPSSITEKDYLIYEAEAQAFAQCLLIPTPSLKENDTLKDIQIKYDVSGDAAIHAYTEYHDRRPWAWPSIRIPKYSFNHPRVYSTPPTTGLLLIVGGGTRIYCHKCKELSISKSKDHSNFCPICGNRNIYVFNQYNSFSFHERFGDKVLKYPDIVVDDDSKVVSCPVCQNEEIDGGDFCKICGTYLTNRCTGIPYNDMHDPFHAFSASQLISSDGCGTLLQGNARFCTSCGCVSTFYIQDLLKDWNDEKSSILAEKAIQKAKSMPS
ncbi:ImmA/IrrE family metallo-endopeptidase [Lactiplantibacillus plantarum]|uniref:ImmA/IrrE family metallo-endopeptidase n=1 Tax=Lactiplantibacillus plantarum TaxID=1590 RepID=UPI000DD3108F|nr:ImmA/IrrE family metallo-endopeptidase [Lactiplantibacillus plantarum]MCJ1648640.1 ImmA/IrrE family metallo-endopeptidase [Lactiplantibacillus plantarum subsp. plantarum]MDI5784211.1 ImmA/IrrE family metallo-endopeptidase [Lactiplantibacillus plantarum]